MHHPACTPPSCAPGPTRGLKYSRCTCCVGCVTLHITHAHRWTFFRSFRARFKKRPGPILSAPKLCLRVCFCIQHAYQQTHQKTDNSGRIHIPVYIHIYLYMYIFVYIYIYIRKYVYIYICVCVCVYICIYIYMYTHTYTLIHVFTRKCIVCLEDITMDVGIYLYVYIYLYIFA